MSHTPKGMTDEYTYASPERDLEGDGVGGRLGRE